MGVKILSIDHYGYVYPCPALNGSKFVFGNVKDEDFPAIHSRMASFCMDLSVENIDGCRACEVRGLCASGCRAWAFHLTNDISGKDPNCQYEQFWQKMFRIHPVTYSGTTFFQQKARQGFPDPEVDEKP